MASLYWVKADLRIQDNCALKEFLRSEGPRFVVYYQDESYRRADQFRKNWIDQTVSGFFTAMQALGCQTIVVRIDFLNHLQELCHNNGVNKIFFTKQFAYHEAQLEKQVSEFLRLKSIELNIFEQETLVHPDDLPFQVQDQPHVFTDFRKKVEAQLKVREVVTQVTNSVDMKTELEVQAWEHLMDYIWVTQDVLHYKETRNGLLNVSDSTRLSKWLSLGVLSPRQIYFEIKKFEQTVRANESTYWVIFELLWRDYFKFLSRKHGNRIFLRSGLRSATSATAKASQTEFLNFERWCKGQTEERFINANMNELNSTGWMSNRGRQNVASYLIHDLQVPWTWGAQYFEKMLVDYDAALNWGNWLYLSGVGTDPRSRKFDIKKQSGLYDPQSLYQKRWQI
jgi:deoxyribodipyrimidine photo-lyase